MTQPAPVYLQSAYIAGARDGQLLGAQVVPNLLGPGRDVIMIEGQSFEIRSNEPVVHIGYTKVLPLQVVNKPLAEVDDRFFPGIREEDL